jgi:hypothetical protein
VKDKRKKSKNEERRKKKEGRGHETLTGHIA